jgi:hypothetical protein
LQARIFGFAAPNSCCKVLRGATVLPFMQNLNDLSVASALRFTHAGHYHETSGPVQPVADLAGDSHKRASNRPQGADAPFSQL